MRGRHRPRCAGTVAWQASNTDMTTNPSEINPTDALDYGIALPAMQGPESAEVQAWRAKRRLTLLHMCALCGGAAGAARLLAQGADPNAVDCHLWTPLHHAALRRDMHMIALLLQHGADKALKNDYGGTYQDVLRLVTPPDERSPQAPRLLYRDAAGVECALTAASYGVLTNTLYVDEDYVPAPAMLALWRAAPGHQGGMFKDSLPVYRQWRDAVRKAADAFVIASACSGMEECGAGLGLFANREYAPFEAVGEYLGEVADAKGDYVLQAGTVGGKPFKVDACRFSNALSRINDGFPNLFLTALGNERGLPCRPILATLDSVSLGEQFCFNYGWHAVKSGPYVELRPQALRAFAATYGLSEWTATLGKIHPLHIDQVAPSDIAFLAQFRYLLQTPKALCALLLEGVIDHDKATAMLAEAAGGHIPVEDFPACRALIDAAGRVVRRWQRAKSSEKQTLAKKAAATLTLDEAVNILQSFQG